ncbi:Uncharacterized conserved protein, DUF58 family, contains vWF domain [Paenibacillus sp. yr247]|uniref:DUF58 domain-containing protein n=1 Tax=Paenibacillus sp. yr247 TaxID=1761880 RepID=UPI00088DC69D|nr:DUF58 domain-containing protein [Paenibacillus sp. yr247]SDO66064.1 Uncharacterized conserved protein, DUF58 family, contains vWF domain [Paenibacillus sp. yr247]
MKSWGKTSLLVVGCVLSIFLAYWQGGFAAWYLGSCLTLIWLQAGLFYVFALKGLTVSRQLSDEVFISGEDVTITLRVGHRMLLPLPWMVVKETWVHEGSGVKLIYSKLLFPLFRSNLLLHYKITGLMRGVYRFAGFEAVTGDLFGFAIRKAFRDDLQRCVVYPKPDSLDRSGMTFHAEDGDVPAFRGPKAETPLISGVRDYVSGDPYHRIHWKSSARLSRLMTKDPEQASSAKRMLLLDAAPAAGPAEAARPLLEKGVALAAGFFEAAAGGRESCGFASSSNGRRIAPTIRPDLPLAYEVLASVGGKPALSFPDLVRKEAAALPLDASMLCITSTLDLALVRAIADARTRRRSVHVIYVHARPSLSVAEREGASQLQAVGCSFTEVPHPVHQWPKQGGVTDATA